MFLPRLFRLGNWVMRALPPRVRYPLAAVTGRCAFYLMPRRRRVAFENFAQVLGLPWSDPLVKRTAHHAFGNYFKMFADFMLMDTLKPEEIRRMVRPQGREQIDRVLEGGKGAIVVTAHVSNWDILAAAAAVYGYPISAVTSDLPRADDRVPRADRHEDDSARPGQPATDPQGTRPQRAGCPGERPVQW
ncbi:MAG: hypothetical protein E6I78_08120 [Chloroflexi bacterium]|nr:MAG: hypothetical protein E6I78_08120 [Chloroflexota bacterium]